MGAIRHTGLVDLEGGKEGGEGRREGGGGRRKEGGGGGGRDVTAPCYTCSLH